MNDLIIETKDLTKCYGKQKSVSDLNSSRTPWKNLWAFGKKRRRKNNNNENAPWSDKT